VERKGTNVESALYEKRERKGWRALYRERCTRERGDGCVPLGKRRRKEKGG